jgi:hypothetical protein
MEENWPKIRKQELKDVILSGYILDTTDEDLSEEIENFESEVSKYFH